MKIESIDDVEVKRVYVDESNKAYLRVLSPEGFVIWYHATDKGFDYVDVKSEHDSLEGAYKTQQGVKHAH